MILPTKNLVYLAVYKCSTKLVQNVGLILKLIFFFAVTVPVYRKRGAARNYQKPEYCFFCKKMVKSKISKHYLGVHITEERVQQIVLLPVSSKERKLAMLKLQNDGNFQHNCEVCTRI